MIHLLTNFYTVWIRRLCAIYPLISTENFHSHSSVAGRVCGATSRQRAKEVCYWPYVYCFLGILNLGCQGIRIRRYVSNGRCTSRRPFRDLICDGQCMPMDELPWFPEYSKVISRRKREWRCVPDEVKTKKVTVVCIDGNKFKYRVRVVRSCKCKRYTHKQNQTNPWRVLFKTKQNLQCGATVKRHSRTDIPSLYCFVM